MFKFNAIAKQTQIGNLEAGTVVDHRGTKFLILHQGHHVKVDLCSGSVPVMHLNGFTINGLTSSAEVTILGTMEVTPS